MEGYLGSDVVITDLGGGTPWVSSPDGTGIVTGLEGTFTVGNITKVELIATMSDYSAASTNRDTDHDGVLEPGEGMDLNLRVTNGSGAIATNVSINNFQVITTVAGTSTPTTCPRKDTPQRQPAIPHAGRPAGRRTARVR